MMYPSEVRARLLADQASLRERLEQLDQLLRHDNVAGMRAQCASLQAQLRQHMQLDDTLLKPELADSDAWSALRVARLEAQHARQLRDLGDIRDVCITEHTSDEEVRALARRVLNHLREDLQEQASLMLSEDVLRDDLINLSRVS